MAEFRRYFTRSRQASPVISPEERRIVRNYLNRVVRNAGGNVKGLNIIINQTSRQRITQNDLNKLNNYEAKKLYNKISRGGPLINNRFKRGWNPLGNVVRGVGGFVGETAKRTATAVVRPVWRVVSRAASPVRNFSNS